MAQLQGKLYLINETKKVSDNYQKREFVVIMGEGTPYPQYIKMELGNARCDIADKFSVGQEVIVDYNLKGNVDKNDAAKVYTKLEAYKIVEA